MSEPTRTGAGETAAPEPPPAAAEPRWPMATAVLVATILYVDMPTAGESPGWWLFPLLQLVLLGLLIAQDPGRIDRRSAALHRLMVALLLVMTLGTVLAVIVLAYDILHAVEGVTAPCYWDGRRHLGRQRDHLQPVVLAIRPRRARRAGRRRPDPTQLRLPGERHPRARAARVATDLSGLPVPGVHNATAFSPTDTLPVRRWAKLTLMVQAALSLVLAILVIARAINVLPG